jgi:hypothetical protein
MKSNCLLFALALYWRRRRWARKRARDGKESARSYLIVRPSRIRWGLIHVLHGKLDRNTGQMKVVSYKPNMPRKTRFAPIFFGHVSRGD